MTRMKAKTKNEYAIEFARSGGLAKSEAKTLSSRENGKLGGRPRKPKKEPVNEISSVRPVGPA